MINISNEDLIRLTDVPCTLPCKTDGRRVHVSTIFRWVQRGVRGIHLEVAKIGGATFTSRQALQRFARGLTAATGPPEHEVAASRKSVRENRLVERELDEAGL